MRTWCPLRDAHPIATRALSTAQPTHAAENARRNGLPVVWNRACILMSRPGGKDHMQGTAAYIGSEQCPDTPARGNDTREAQDVFSRYLLLLHRTAYRYLANAADAEDAVQEGRHKFRRGSLPSSAIVLGCNYGEGHARFMCHSTSNLGTSKDTQCQIGWWTADRIPKKSIKRLNCVTALCSSRKSFRPRCAEHSSCATWMVSLPVKRHRFWK